MPRSLNAAADTRPSAAFSEQNIPSCENIHMVFGLLLSHLSQRRPEVSIPVQRGMYAVWHIRVYASARILILRSLTHHSVRRIVCAWDQGLALTLPSFSWKTPRLHTMFWEEWALNGFQRWNLLLERAQKVIWGYFLQERLLSPTKAQQTDVKWQLLCFLTSLTLKSTHTLYRLSRPGVEKNFGYCCSSEL